MLEKREATRAPPPRALYFELILWPAWGLATALPFFCLSLHGTILPSFIAIILPFIMWQAGAPFASFALSSLAAGAVACPV